MMTEFMRGTSEILNNFFDHKYVINLTRATDRKAHITKIFDGLDYEFLVATDKQGISYEESLQKGVITEQNEEHLSRFPEKLTLAHIACSLSHRRTYEDMLQNGYDQVMVFEDDITVMPEAKNLEKAIAELPKDWDVFLLGHLKTKNLSPKRKFDQWMYRMFKTLHLFKWNRRSNHYINNRYTTQYSENLLKIGEFTGLHAYGVSRAGAEKLVKHQTPICYTADGLVNFSNLQAGDLNMYGISPSLFSQESDDGQFASFISDYKPEESV